MNEQTIFLAALDIAESAERAAYLKRACAGDPAMLRQVERLLAAHERSGEFLDVPALEQVAARVSEPESSPAETSFAQQSADGQIDLSFLQPARKPGSLGRLGHYEVEEVVGRGGCGIVLKAFDEMLHRPVAIKVMAPELAATSPARKRFLREARAAAAIRHENVVSIHAVEDQPIPFLVMEYIAGQTLQQKLDETGPLDVRDVVRIGQQIASGLEAAHAMGLIHRDIKPGNILLEKGRDRVKITDFGLARAGDDASMTQSGVIAGTPLYMSPEQARGDAIDQRSDLFSLGSVLYVMCSGRPPFRTATTLAVLNRVTEDQPRPIQEIIPEAPQWLTAIIAKLHAKEPANRFASAQETASLLARCLSELQQQGRVESLGEVLPVIPKPTGASSQAVVGDPASIEQRPAPGSRPPLARRRRWLAAAAVLLVLAAGLGWSESSGLTNLRGTVVRLFSPDGTLVVEVDDPGVTVSIDGEELLITGTGAKEIRLKPGQYKLLASKNGMVVHQELVTVTTNGRQVVRVSTEAAPATIAPESAPAKLSGPHDYDKLATGRWQSVLTAPGPAVARRNAIFGDGLIEIQNGHAYDSAIQAADLIIRAKVQKLSGQNVMLTLRDIKGVYYSAFYHFDGREEFGVGMRGVRFVYGVKQHFEATAGVREGEFFELAFAAIGDTLTVYANGKQVGAIRDGAISQAGGVAVHATQGKGAFKDVEVMVLDKAGH